MQTVTHPPVTAATPHAVVMDASRRTAAKVAERLLPYYEAAYPRDLRPRMALPVALDFASGTVDEKTLAHAEAIARAALDDANRQAETCAIHQVARYWAAADAAEAVLEALGPVVDLAAVNRLARDARDRFRLTKEQAS